MRNMIFLLTVIVASCGPTLAGAKDHSKWANAPYHDWYEKQYSLAGQWCCDKGDAYPYYGTFTTDAKGGITIQAEDGPHHFAAGQLVDPVRGGPNPTGHAVYWHSMGIDWCFAPGAMG